MHSLKIDLLSLLLLVVIVIVIVAVIYTLTTQDESWAVERCLYIVNCRNGKKNCHKIPGG